MCVTYFVTSITVCEPRSCDVCQIRLHDVRLSFTGLTENAGHVIVRHENTGHEFPRHEKYRVKIDYIT